MSLDSSVSLDAHGGGGASKSQTSSGLRSGELTIFSKANQGCDKNECDKVMVVDEQASRRRGRYGRSRGI